MYKLNLEEVMKENSTYTRSTLKRRLIKEGKLEERCNICHINNTWNNKPLVLILDHINGIFNDNRLENLQLVCPNCNSQLDTFAGRNVKTRRRYIKTCSNCGIKVSHKSDRCRICNGKRLKPNRRKIQWPTLEELEIQISNSNKLTVSKRLGVSETAVRKMLSRLKRSVLA